MVGSRYCARPMVVSVVERTAAVKNSSGSSVTGAVSIKQIRVKVSAVLNVPAPLFQARNTTQ